VSIANRANGQLLDDVHEVDRLELHRVGRLHELVERGRQRGTHRDLERRSPLVDLLVEVELAVEVGSEGDGSPILLADDVARVEEIERGPHGDARRPTLLALAGVADDDLSLFGRSSRALGGHWRRVIGAGNRGD